MRLLVIAVLALLTGCAANRWGDAASQDVPLLGERTVLAKTRQSKSGAGHTALGTPSNSRGGVPHGIAPKIRPIENGKPVPRETSFNNRFGRWRKVTVDVWIPNKGD